MPALPSKTIRRKTATPITKLNQEDVWQRTLDLMGLEPLNSKVNGKMAMQVEEEYVSSSPSTLATQAQGSQNGEGKKLTILDLPLETKKDIFKHASSADLIALSLVSKHFRDIAAEQLYRSFHIVFPDEDDPSNDSPIDGLAGGLDTFVTSEYDYAKYLREIILETLSGGDKGERAYRHYLYDVSCGKFMNTLLLLTLRKAKALETFRWDIRVELSRQVFKALHEIEALQHLHLRMQVGPSIYQAPPTLPTSSVYTNTGSSFPPPPPHGSFPSTLPPPPIPLAFPGPPNQWSLGSKISTKIHHKNVKGLLHSIRKTPPTLSGFKDLKTLSILDMDTLDYVSEINTCIRNCSSTLNTLKLSFSEALANKSRKPPPEIQSDDDSDQEDEFGQLIPPPGPPPGLAPSGASDPNGPSKALKAQEEKKKQEAVLGRIFGFMALKPAKPVLPKNADPDEPKSDAKIISKEVTNLIAKLLSTIQPGYEYTTEGKTTLEMMEKATRKAYIDGAGRKKSPDETTRTGSAGSSTAKATPASSSASIDGTGDDVAVMTGAIPDQPGLFDEPEKKKKEPTTDSGVSNPDDIDVEEPEGQELAIDFEAPASELHPDVEPGEIVESKSGSEAGPVAPNIDSVGWANRIQVLEHHFALRTEHDQIEKEGQRLKELMDQFKAKLESGKLEDSDYQELAAAEAAYHDVAGRLDELSRNLEEVNEQIDDLKASEAVLKKAPGSESAKMSDYVRKTRGLTLKNLAIYLIPIKASILSRAIDLTVLQSITLLNVGPQIPFWNLLARENKTSSLPLRKIHTDNVTLPFLAFVSQLDTLTELFLLERTAKARVESTAAKTTVTIEQIRRVILKKHAHTLRILMIRNDAGVEWDLNVKTAMLLCQRAKALEELAVSFGIRTMHTLLQLIPGLTSLRVLQTIQFRTDDTCMWVMKEFRKFAVDNISHNPDMKLEYLALETSVERLVRRTPKVAPKRKMDVKGKGKETDKGKESEGGIGLLGLADLVMGSGGDWAHDLVLNGTAAIDGVTGNGNGSLFADMESSDEESDYYGLGGSSSGKGLRVETVEGIKFCDVPGVRIFEKDVLWGRL